MHVFIIKLGDDIYMIFAASKEDALAILSPTVGDDIEDADVNDYGIPTEPAEYVIHVGG